MDMKIMDLFDVSAVRSPYIRTFLSRYVYPWEMLPDISSYLAECIKNGLDGFTEISSGVFVGKNVEISPTATIIGPAIIGHNTVIRPGAYIRGKVLIGEDCVIGNSTELKNSVILDDAKLPHYNYVGDSVIGLHAHMGAGAICSNFKADGSDITVRDEKPIATHLRKLGGILGDYADIGCGCVLNPGTVVGSHTSVYPLTCLRGVYPAGCIVKSVDNIVKRV